MKVTKIGLNRFVDEATRIEDALSGALTQPFTHEVSYDDLRDFARDAKRLAWYLVKERWDCSNMAVEHAATKRAQEIVVEEGLLSPEDIDLDQHYYRRHGG